MPILYYKANKLKAGNFAYTNQPSMWPSNTYNLDDSFLNDGSGNSLGIIGYPAGYHPLSYPTNSGLFYDAIQNPNFPGDQLTSVPGRPYRSESFILQSAGPDGLYGTTDDVFNFDLFCFR